MSDRLAKHWNDKNEAIPGLKDAIAWEDKMKREGRPLEMDIAASEEDNRVCMTISLRPSKDFN